MPIFLHAPSWQGGLKAPLKFSDTEPECTNRSLMYPAIVGISALEPLNGGVVALSIDNMYTPTSHRTLRLLSLKTGRLISTNESMESGMNSSCIIKEMGPATPVILLVRAVLM
jgi:hypothetical protein